MYVSEASSVIASRLLQVVVVCTLSVFISMFVKNDTIQISIPTSNGYVYSNATDNTTKYGNYTGLRASTFKQNLYGQWNSAAAVATDCEQMKSGYLLPAYVHASELRKEVHLWVDVLAWIPGTGL